MPDRETIISTRHRTLSDPEDFDGVVSGMQLKVNYRLRHTGHSSVSQYQSPQFAFDFGELHVRAHLHGAVPQEWASMCILRGDSRAVFNGQAGSHGDLFFLPPGAGLDGCTEPAMRWTTIAIPKAKWEACRQIAGSEESPKPHPGLRLSPARRQYLCARLEHIEALLGNYQDDTGSVNWAGQSAVDFAMECATMVWEEATLEPLRPDSLRNRLRLARRAHDWMVERIGTCISIGDLCLALCVSRRELEYAFRTTLDTSPAEHLKILRLNAIRIALRDASRLEQSIGKVAADHGVTHFGRFSAHYRDIFGEPPSATRRNRFGRLPQ